MRPLIFVGFESDEGKNAEYLVGDDVDKVDVDILLEEGMVKPFTNASWVDEFARRSAASIALLFSC
jgi:hypothetical protein